MSAAEKNVIEVVTAELDRRELKALRFAIIALLGVLVSIAVASLTLGQMISELNISLKAANASVLRHEVALRAAQDESLRALADRFYASDYETAVSIFNMRSPGVSMPYLNEVRRTGKRP